MSTADDAASQLAELRSKLQAVLGPALGVDAADVTIEWRTSSHGANRITFACDAVTPGGRRALALQAARRTDVPRSFEREARGLGAAEAAGAPVPHVLLADDSPAALGAPFLIRDAVEGETDFRQILGKLDSADALDGRMRLLRQCGQALAAIHRADTDGLELARPDALDQMRQELDRCGAGVVATFEWAFRWLAAHRPPPSPAVLVHGHYQTGNFVVDGTSLAAVLGWEMLHIGEAYEDLAWFCAGLSGPSGRGPDLAAAGLGTIESFLDAYQEASGTTVDRVSFHWWLMLATLRWGVFCHMAAQQVMKARGRTMELAAMGRQRCETEWDLLNLLDGAAHR